MPQAKALTGFRGYLVNGYELGAILEASSGTPFTVGFGGDALGLASTDPTLDVPSVLNTPNCSSLVNPGQVNYVKTECFILPQRTADIAPANCNTPAADPNACLNLLGNLGRNRLVGPGLVNLDFSIFKNNKIRRISESFNAQFRVEIFNILNRTNFAPPTDNLAIFDGDGTSLAPQNGGTGGQITSTSVNPRLIQLALKYVF